MGVLFFVFPTMLYHVHFSAAARGEPIFGGFLVKFAAIWFAFKQNGRVMILFWPLSIILYDVYFFTVTRREPVCRRVSRVVCGDFGSPPSGTGGCGLWFGVFQSIYTTCISPRLHGENRFAGGSLEKFAAIVVRPQAEREGSDFVLASFQQFNTMYISPRLRWGNRFVGGSLETFAAIWLASKRNGRVEILFWRLFNNFMPYIFIPGCTGGTGLPAGL